MSSSLDNMGIGMPALLEYLRANQQFQQQSGGAPLTPFNEQMLQQAQMPDFDLASALQQAESQNPDPRRGWSENFAQALAGMQFGPPRNFGEGLVQGLARGFSGATMNRQATAEEKAESRRKAASELAKARWERVNEEKDAAKKALMSSAEKAMTEQGRMTRAEAAEAARWDRLLKSMEGQNARLSASLSARYGGATPQDQVEAWATQIHTGQREITNVPVQGGMRNAVNAYMVANGLDTTPKKYREVMGTLASAEAVVENLAELVPKVNKGGAVQRALQFPGTAAKIAFQTDPDIVQYNAETNGFLAIMARAFGERGVLTDQDVARAKKMMPSPYDEKHVAERKIKDLREFFKDQKLKAHTAWASPGPASAVGAPQKNNDPLGIR